jgi:hypothetical protein
MNIENIEKTAPAPDLCSPGIRGWHVTGESGELGYDLLELEPFRPFGGDCARNQVWEILDGEGLLSIDERMVRMAVIPKDAIQIEAGERALLIARTQVRVAIRPSLHAAACDQRPFFQI